MTDTESADQPYDAGGVLRPPPEAVSLSATRTLPDGSTRRYTSVTPTGGWTAVEHFTRTCWAMGLIRAAAANHTDGYADLDVLNPAGETIAAYHVPTPEAFAFIKAKLGLRYASAPDLIGVAR